MRIPEGFKCDPGILPHLAKVFHGEYDVPVVGYRPLTILDLGANFGSFALWAADKWKDSTIHCYEPHPKTAAALRENLRFTPTGTQTAVHEVAVAGRKGYTHLFEGESNSGEATILHGNAASTNVVHPVELITPLELPVADILKMDIEGCEVDVLGPLIEAGRKFSAVMFEYHRTDDRRILDNLLSDYVLTGGEVYCPEIGVMKYVHKDVMLKRR